MIENAHHLKVIEQRLLWLSHWMIHNANHIRPKADGIKVGGHQASSASMVSIMTALYFSALRPEDIPTTAPTEITSVVDLAKPEVAALFRKRIQGINPGAGISGFSRQMIMDYGLADLGFHFENGTVEDCTGAALDAVAKNELVVVPLWYPQWLHQEVELRELADPMGLLSGQDDATLVLRRDAAAKLKNESLAYLRSVHLGNKAVSEIDHMICREGLSFIDAAKAWLDSRG